MFLPIFFFLYLRERERGEGAGAWSWRPRRRGSRTSQAEPRGGAPGGSVAAPVLPSSASFPGGVQKGVEE